MARDRSVQRWLRERRLVRLIVPVAPVANQVDEKALPEALAIGHAQSHRLNAGLRIVRVHVHDWNLEPFGQVARVVRGARVDGIRRESHLVVRNDVHRAADAIAAEELEIERFRDDPFAGKRGVAVQDHGEHAQLVPLARRATGHALLGPNDSHCHRIDQLEVAWIGDELQLDRAPCQECRGWIDSPCDT